MGLLTSACPDLGTSNCTDCVFGEPGWHPSAEGGSADGSGGHEEGLRWQLVRLLVLVLALVLVLVLVLVPE